MTENPTSNAHEYDEELAEFSNQLLDSDSTEMVEITTQDEELRTLQETVLKFEKVFGREEPDQAMTARIRARLVAEWRDNEGTVRLSWWQRVVGQWLSWNTPAVRRRTRRLAFVAGVFIVLTIAVLLGSPDEPDALPGAAVDGSGNSIVPIVFAGIVVGGVFWWAIRRRR